MSTAEDAGHRRFASRFAPPMAIYLVLLMGMPKLISSVNPTWIKMLLSFLPLLPVTWAMIELVRHVARLDELQRRLHFEAGGIAALLTCFLMFCWGLVELWGVTELAGLPRLNGVAVMPIFLVIFVFRYWKTRRQID